MKKITFLLPLVFCFIFIGFSQTASTLISGQRTPVASDVPNLTWMDPATTGSEVGRIKVVDKNYLRLDTFNINNLSSYISLRCYTKALSDARYLQITNFTWSGLTGKPTFATVATTGDYADLTNKPPIPTDNSQIANGAGYVTDTSALLRKSTAAATYQTKGIYLTSISSSDVTGALGFTPISSSYTGFDSRYVQTSNFTWINLSGKPIFSTVATSGSYSDLSGKPSIPAAQVNSDWSSNTGVSQVLNKPTTLAGYGITDGLQPTGNGSSLTGLTKTQVGLSNVDNTSDLNKPISSATQTALNGKLSSEVDGSVTNEIQTLSITGSNLTISGSGGNTVNLKKSVPYSGVTSGSGGTLGTYTVTFSTAYSVAPNIQANIVGGTPNQTVVPTVTTTGFTVTAYQRNTVNLLSTEVLLGNTVATNGLNIDVLITEK
jgi:hypothetical protein